MAQGVRSAVRFAPPRLSLSRCRLSGGWGVFTLPALWGLTMRREREEEKEKTVSGGGRGKTSRQRKVESREAGADTPICRSG